MTKHGVLSTKACTTNAACPLKVRKGLLDIDFLTKDNTLVYFEHPLFHELCFFTYMERDAVTCKVVHAMENGTAHLARHGRHILTANDGA